MFLQFCRDDLADLPHGLQTHQYAVRQHEPFASVYVEERIYKEESWHRQLLMLNLLPFTLRSMNPKELNYSQEELASPRTVTVNTIMGSGSAIRSEIQLRDEHLAHQNAVLTVIKTIYATPITRRSLDWTRAILESFDTALIQDACLRAKEWKVLVTVRGSTYRIPGQRVGRSERFTQVMAGAYPRAMSLAAADSAKHFAGLKTWTFDEESSAADMMAITNEIAMDRVKLSMVPPSEPDVIKAPEAYFLNTQLTFDVMIENLHFKETQISPTTSGLKRADRDDEEENTVDEGAKRIKTIEEPFEPEPAQSWTEVRERTAAALEKYLGTVPDPQKRRLLQDIFTIVMTSEAVGMTLIDIKVKGGTIKKIILSQFNHLFINQHCPCFLVRPHLTWARATSMTAILRMRSGRWKDPPHPFCFLLEQPMSDTWPLVGTSDGVLTMAGSFELWTRMRTNTSRKRSTPWTGRHLESGGQWTLSWTRVSLKRFSTPSSP